MIGRNGERGSRISALAARHDDDDDICCTPYIMDLPSTVNTRQRERQTEFTRSA